MPAAIGSEMLLPHDLRQLNVDAEDASERALDLDVVAGEDGSAAPVLAVLVGVEREPAAAQDLRLRPARWRLRLGGGAGGEPDHGAACEKDREKAADAKSHRRAAGLLG